MDPRVSKSRSRVAVAYRIGDPEQIETARRELAAANIESYIEKVVASAPPLTAEQRDRLAVLLRSGDAA